ncbi:hypothetical protein LTR15_012831 [Elasticomyces elasticus]|nr:hypothetical protein LTR15_012831 [Elasticomyces elasticus]
MANSPLHPLNSTLVFAPSFTAKLFDPEWTRNAYDSDIAAELVPHIFDRDEVDLLIAHGFGGVQKTHKGVKGIKKVAEIRERVQKTRGMHEQLRSRAGENARVPMTWYTPPQPREFDNLEMACLAAKLGGFYDVELRASIGSLLQGCLPAFDWGHFEKLEKALPEKKNAKMMSLWCPEHKRFEVYWAMQPLYYQLGTGRLSFEEYAMVVSRCGGQDPCPGQVHGSHLCGHNWCIGLNCVIWEQPHNNFSRKDCHESVAGRDPHDPNPLPPCDCDGFETTGIACDLFAASQIKKQPFRKRIIELRRNNRAEYATCPMCSKLVINDQMLKAGTGHPDAKKSKNQRKHAGPTTYYTDVNSRIRKHMKEEHGWRDDSMFTLRTK